jgi:hypothetical protein
MSEDRILSELGHLAKEEREAERARLDERWDRMAAGTLTPEEEAELRALAESSPEARETYEAFHPLGPEFQARIVDTLAAGIDKPEPKIEPEKRRPRLLPFRPATLRSVRWVTAAAAAAGLFLLLRGPALGPPLPVYTAAKPAGGIQVFRGEENPDRVFTPGSQLMLVVKPQHAVTGEVEAQAFLARGDEWISWRPEIKIAESGSVRLQGELGREIQPGDWKVWVAVGRPGDLPSLDELQAEVRAGRTRDDRWQAVSADLRVVSQPPT